MSSRTPRPPVAGALLGLAIGLGATMPVRSQSGACALAPDEHKPAGKNQRCGDDLLVRAAPGTSYHTVDQQGTELPKALQLDAGALMIEFHPSGEQKDFQILTPRAIAAVRGTKWVVEVAPARTSTLVISGEVAVKRLHADQTVVLGPGQGVDVSAGRRPLAVKRWPKPRVKALLARFGE
jgi:hypothetical protein